MLRRFVAAAAISIVFLGFLSFEVSAAFPAFVPKQTGLSSFNIYDPVSGEPRRLPSSCVDILLDALGSLLHPLCGLNQSAKRKSRADEEVVDFEKK